MQEAARDSAGTPLVAVRSWYASRLVPEALAHLPRLLLPDGTAFCFRAVPDAAGRLALEGRSDRYTAISLIGLAAQERLGARVEVGLERAWDRVASWGADAATRPGDAGLALWALAERGDERTSSVALALGGRAREILSPARPFASMETAWLLAGLCRAASSKESWAGRLGDAVHSLAAGIAGALLANQSPSTGLFPLGRSPRRLNVVAAAEERRLGSFASQTYPVAALAAYAAWRAAEDGSAPAPSAALAAAVRCADRLCALQGPAGQWWWIYHVESGEVVVRYPVFSVHQDGMAPMALLCVLAAAGATGAARLSRGPIDAGAPAEARARPDVARYAAALLAGLEWSAAPPEMRGETLEDGSGGTLWRAIQRDPAGRTGGFDLGPGERLRMKAAAFLRTTDRRPLLEPHLCRECRPYHLGWVLLAGALAASGSDASSG